MDEKSLIKQRVDLVELISESVPLAKAGRNYRGLCPFHSEKTPSFMVNPELGVYKCFGCGAGGDCFSWMMAIDNLTFGQALQELAKRVGIPLTSFQPDKQTQQIDQILELLSVAKEFFHWLLVKHRIGQPARDYLNSRGIDQAAIRTFQIGWSPDTWDGLQRYLVTKKHYSLQLLDQAGLVVLRSDHRGAYDRFRGRVMFPLHNHRGQTLGFSGRVLPQNPSPTDKTPAKYINTPETDVYHKRELLFALETTKSHIKSASRAIIVEGELDAISSWQSGVKEVVAIKGSALTPEQVTTLKRLCDVVILALDMDIAGDAAARRGIVQAESAGLEVRVARLPQGKDPDELARKDPAAWKQAVDQAVEVYRFLIDSSSSRHGLTTAHSKRKITQELLPILSEITSPILQSHWLSELAKTLSVKDEVIWQELNSSHRSTSKSSSVSIPPPAGGSTLKPPRRELLETYLVGWYLHSHPLNLLKPEITALLQLPWSQRLVSILQDYPSNDQPLKIADLPLPPELQTKIAEVLMLSDYDPEATRSGDILAKMIEELDLKDQLRQLHHHISKLEQQHQDAELLSAQEQFSKLSHRLAQIGNKKV